MKSWIKSIRARQRGSPQRGIVAFFNVATRDFFFFFSHRENRAKANKDREGRGLRPLAFSCRCTPKSIDDDHPSCKAIVDRGQGGRSNDASSVNQAISFREEANEDTAWTTIDFLLTILSWKSLHETNLGGGFPSWLSRVREKVARCAFCFQVRNYSSSSTLFYRRHHGGRECWNGDFENSFNFWVKF